MNMIDFYQLKKTALRTTTSDGTKKYFITSEEYKDIKDLLKISDKKMNESYVQMMDWGTGDE